MAPQISRLRGFLSFLIAGRLAAGHLAAMYDPRLLHPAAISDETRAFNQALALKLADWPATHEVPPEVTRKARAEGRGIIPLAGPDPRSTWVEIGDGRQIRLSSPLGRRALAGVYVHVHGGGWTLGAPEQFDRPNLAIADGAHMQVVSVRYRLAPEHPWPAQRDDVMAALEWVLAQYPDLPVFIGGESAGAHLAVAALIQLRARGLMGRITGATLWYGCYDLRMTPSMANWGARKLILSTPTVAWFRDNLAADPQDPTASPLLADLGGLCPAWFCVGTCDPLLDDTLFMAARWVAAGNAADVHIAPGGVHAFDGFDLEIARQARAAQLAWLQARLR